MNDSIIKWKVSAEGGTVDPVTGYDMAVRRLVCDKYPDIIKVESRHSNVVKKYYVDLLDDTEHISISALLINRKTKAKQRAEREEPKTLAEAAEIYRELQEKDETNENNPVG